MSNNIAYLQVDLRYNGWLMRTIGERYAIEYTLDRMKQLGCKKMVAGIYRCKENEPVIRLLKDNGIQIIMSDDEDVNSRFLNIAIKETADYVVRVCADQVLFDFAKTNEILDDMKRKNKELFYNPDVISVLPDIVRIDVLKRYMEDILKEKRYFEALIKQELVERYVMSWPCILMFSFRVDSYSGYRICKIVIEKKLDVYELSLNLARKLQEKGTYLYKTGIWQSWILGNPYEDYFYDADGMVNPWWGKTTVELVRKKLTKNIRVFEWGSGNSTLFWSQYVGSVVSVEHDLKWYERMKEIVPNNVKLKYCKLEYGGEYCKKILDEKEKFDIILIDGRDRVNCALNSIEHLNERGIIIWDDTQREAYQDGYEFIKKHGFKQLELRGIIYGVPSFEGSTSIFYREDNIFDL